MTRKLSFMATAAALALLSSPAMANNNKDFQGAKIAAIGGYDNISGFDGFVYGGAIGYDLQSGSVVYGIEGEISDTTAGPGAIIGRDLYIGGRLGYALSPKALLYVKAGYDNFRVFGTNLDGVRVGAGLEYNVSDSIFLRGEYRYTDSQFGIDRHQAIAAVGFKF